MYCGFLLHSEEAYFLENGQLLVNFFPKRARRGLLLWLHNITSHNANKKAPANNRGGTLLFKDIYSFQRHGGY